MNENILFREYRGTFKESIKTMTRFSTLSEMLKYVSKIYKVNEEIIQVKLLENEFDERLEWHDIYLIFVDDINYGYNELLGYFTIL